MHSLNLVTASSIGVDVLLLKSCLEHLFYLMSRDARFVKFFNFFEELDYFQDAGPVVRCSDYEGGLGAAVVRGSNAFRNLTMHIYGGCVTYVVKRKGSIFFLVTGQGNVVFIGCSRFTSFSARPGDESESHVRSVDFLPIKQGDVIIFAASLLNIEPNTYLGEYPHYVPIEHVFEYTEQTVLESFNLPLLGIVMQRNRAITNQGRVVSIFSNKNLKIGDTVLLYHLRDGLFRTLPTPGRYEIVSRLYPGLRSVGAGVVRFFHPFHCNMTCLINGDFPNFSEETVIWTFPPHTTPGGKANASNTESHFFSKDSCEFLPVEHCAPCIFKGVYDATTGIISDVGLGCKKIIPFLQEFIDSVVKKSPYTLEPKYARQFDELSAKAFSVYFFATEHMLPHKAEERDKTPLDPRKIEVKPSRPFLRIESFSKEKGSLCFDHGKGWSVIFRDKTISTEISIGPLAERILKLPIRPVSDKTVFGDFDLFILAKSFVGDYFTFCEEITKIKTWPKNPFSNFLRASQTHPQRCPFSCPVHKFRRPNGGIASAFPRMPGEPAAHSSPLFSKVRDPKISSMSFSLKKFDQPHSLFSPDSGQAPEQRYRAFPSTARSGSGVFHPPPESDVFPHRRNFFEARMPAGLKGLRMNNGSLPNLAPFDVPPGTVPNTRFAPEMSGPRFRPPTAMPLQQATAPQTDTSGIVRYHFPSLKTAFISFKDSHRCDGWKSSRAVWSDPSRMQTLVETVVTFQPQANPASIVRRAENVSPISTEHWAPCQPDGSFEGEVYWQETRRDPAYCYGFMRLPSGNERYFSLHFPKNMIGSFVQVSLPSDSFRSKANQTQNSCKILNVINTPYSEPHWICAHVNKILEYEQTCNVLNSSMKGGLSRETCAFEAFGIRPFHGFLAVSEFQRTHTDIVYFRLICPPPVLKKMRKPGVSVLFSLRKGSFFRSLDSIAQAPRLGGGAKAGKGTRQLSCWFTDHCCLDLRFRARFVSNDIPMEGFRPEEAFFENIAPFLIYGTETLVDVPTAVSVCRTSLFNSKDIYSFSVFYAWTSKRRRFVPEAVDVRIEPQTSFAEPLTGILWMVSSDPRFSSILFIPDGCSNNAISKAACPDTPSVSAGLPFICSASMLRTLLRELRERYELPVTSTATFSDMLSLHPIPVQLARAQVCLVSPDAFGMVLGETTQLVWAQFATEIHPI
eukprot:gnl/Chilomastix_cuspidata/1982.p1 GENE.gnl/Chilomastix_cuspidata/1982~~gnl/Chilomastix_cuspidata/1982.p1  ORF type:complete len:1188 (+),score=257.40 gnl/Chilomastix_cuspidata/1982:434-3997(+)